MQKRNVEWKDYFHTHIRSSVAHIYVQPLTDIRYSALLFMVYAM